MISREVEPAISKEVSRFFIGRIDGIRIYIPKVTGSLASCRETLTFERLD